MSDVLVQFLRARLDETTAALMRYRDGHDGPCLNVLGQDPDEYDEFDSCVLHLEAAQAMPYRDAAFGLAEVEAKRAVLDEHSNVNDGSCGTCVNGHWGYPTHGGSSPQRFPCKTLRLLARPFRSHPDFDPAWLKD